MDEPNALLISSLSLLFIAVLLVPTMLADLRGSVFSIRELRGSLLLIGLLTLSCSAVLTLLLGSENLILALALAIGLLVGLAQPSLALSFFMSLLILRPWEFLPDNELALALPKTFAVLSLASLAVHMLLQRKFVLLWNESFLLFCAYLSWLVIASLLSGNMDDGLPYISEHFTPSFVLCLLAVNCLRRPADIPIVLRTLILSASGLILCAIYMTEAHPQISPDGIVRLASIGLLGNANDLAAIIALTLPFCLSSLFKSQKALLPAVFYSTQAGILIYGLILTQSRGAILALIVSGLTYLFFCTRMKIWRKIPLIILFAFAPILLSQLIQRDGEELAGSTSSRMNYVIAGMRMLKAHPLFGVGVGKYPKQYELYTPSFYEWGERTAHSSWVLAFSESGLIGGLLFSLLFLSVLTQVWRVRFLQPVLLCSLLSYLTAISFLSHTYLFLPYLLYGLVIAAARNCSVAQPELPESTPNIFVPARAAGGISAH